jgi:chromosome segregation ATPase
MMDTTGNPPDGEDLATLRDQLARARNEVERLRHDATAAQSRADQAAAEAAVLRGELQSSDERLAAAETDATDLRTQLADATDRVRAAAERYRDLVVKTEPALPAELIAGDTVDAVDAAVESARAMVGRVRSHLEAQAHAARVPAGAPPRSSPDLSAMTPEQKIRHGLARRS